MVGHEAQGSQVLQHGSAGIDRPGVCPPTILVWANHPLRRNQHVQILGSTRDYPRQPRQGQECTTEEVADHDLQSGRNFAVKPPEVEALQGCCLSPPHLGLVPCQSPHLMG